MNELQDYYITIASNKNFITDDRLEIHSPVKTGFISVVTKYLTVIIEIVFIADEITRASEFNVITVNRWNISKIAAMFYEENLERTYTWNSREYLYGFCSTFLKALQEQTTNNNFNLSP